MASLVIQQENKTPVLAQSRITKYDKGSSFVIEPAGNVDYKKAVVNKGPKNLSLLFEMDADGDSVLVNALKYIQEQDPVTFTRIRSNIPKLLAQLRKMG